MVVVLAVLVTLFAAYCTTHYLEHAVYSLMPISTVIKLILLKTTIALEVLIPSTLYLSVIVGMGRLYKDGEITALHASGASLVQVMTIVFTLSLLVSLPVAGLSLSVRPWAYKQSFLLKAKAKAEFDVTRLEAGKFYEIGKRNRFIFINKIDHQRKKAEGVFIQQIKKNEDNVLEVMYAKEAYQHLDQSTGKKIMLFLNGHIYRFPVTGKKGGSAIKFNQIAYPLWQKEIAPLEYKIKAASTIDLARSYAPSDIAELQWRFSTPLSTILLALFGIPLSRTTSREGKYGKVVIAMFIYALYYSMSSIAKILVTQELMPPLPGIWWVQGLLSVLLIILLLRSYRQL